MQVLTVDCGQLPSDSVLSDPGVLSNEYAKGDMAVIAMSLDCVQGLRCGACRNAALEGLLFYW